MLRQLFETFLETTETEKQDDGTVDDAHAHLEYSTQASVGLWALQLPELKIAAASRLSWLDLLTVDVRSGAYLCTCDNERLVRSDVR
jgi:hypothetical protein